MKRKALLCVFLTMALTGCARAPDQANVDPYEKFNRVVFAFNQDIDHLVYRPVATIYHGIVPPPLQKGITNAFDNVAEVTTMSNDILQGKLKYAVLDFWRLLINSTIGIGGLIDVATHLGLPQHHNDFGMTLAYWSGRKQSPYLQIPFLGPSTFRDGFGMAFDYVMSPYPYIRPNALGWGILGLRLTSIRANYLSTDKLVDDAFDPYIFVRNAYLQSRDTAVETNNRKERVSTSLKPSRFRNEDSEALKTPALDLDESPTP